MPLDSSKFLDTVNAGRSLESVHGWESVVNDLALRVPHVRVLRADELRDGELMPVEIDGTPVVLVRHAGEFFAVQNNCSHRDFPLSEAGFDPRDGVLVCAWHGGCFDVRSGDAVVPPATDPVETFEVRVVDGWVEIALTGSLARDRGAA